MKLSETLNKTITDFCRNGFTSSVDNHCAHFVCHVLALDFGYTCKMLVNGKHFGVCIRVQELFAQCSKVGYWSDAPEGMQLVFVTDKSNVDLTAHIMRNVPKKHVGIFSGGGIYHYSNTDDKVICQRPDEFLTRFQGVYGGNQVLFFGTFPPTAKVPDPETESAGLVAAVTKIDPALTGPLPAIRREIVPGGKFDYFATLPEVKEYYIARNTSYNSLKGLWQPVSKLNGPRYNTADFSEDYETVAGMLGVIAAGESSGYFNRLNTYDRAAFTFGFFQFAAHTPNDNLILLFRSAVVNSATFRSLFPDLGLVHGALHFSLGDHMVSLETSYPRPGHPSEKNLKDFMTYLNEDGANIDDRELSVAARLIHLANTEEAFNRLQVRVAAQITMGKLRNAYCDRYRLDGVSDLICTAIADIHHQGRGTKAEVQKALLSANTVKGKVDALCKVGEAKFPERCATLKEALAKAEADGCLGISTFDQASGLFRPKNGWPV